MEKASLQMPRRALVRAALNSLEKLVTLMTPAGFNASRFESCRSQVLELPLEDSEIAKMGKLFDKARLYFEYDQLGAGKYELKIVAFGLRNHLHRIPKPNRQC